MKKVVRLLEKIEFNATSSIRSNDNIVNVSVRHPPFLLKPNTILTVPNFQIPLSREEADARITMHIPLAYAEKVTSRLAAIQRVDCHGGHRWPTLANCLETVATGELVDIKRNYSIMQVTE